MNRIPMKSMSWMVLSFFTSTAFGWNGNPANDAAYSEEKGYVWLQGEDNQNSNSWTNGFKWKDGIVPDSTRDFYVPYKGNSIFMPRASSEAAAIPFAGRSLVVASQIYYSGASGQWGNLGDNVTMLGGSRFFWSVVGNITGTRLSLANSDETWPVRFSVNTRSDWRYDVNMNVPVKADSDAYLVWTTEGSNKYGVKYILGKNWPDFYGTANLLSNNIFQATSFSMPGHLRLGDGVVFRLAGSSGTSVFGGFSVDASSSLQLTSANNTHVVSVTGKLDLAEGATVKGEKFTSWSNGTPPTYQVFSLSPEAVAAGVPDMTKVRYELYQNGLYYAGFPTAIWVETARADGGCDIGITYKEIVSITNNMLEAATPFYEDGGEKNAPSHFMSDGQGFHAGVDYYANNHNLFVKALKYPYVFSGDSLVLNSESSIGLYGSFTCTNLVLVSNGRFRMMSWGQVFELDGSMKIYRNPNNVSRPAWRFGVACGGTYKVKAPIFGDGDIVGFIELPSGARKTHTRGNIELLGDNSAYTGRIILQAGKAGDFSSVFSGVVPYAPSSVSNVTLTVHRQENLGGPLAKFTPDSLCVSNECRVVLADTAVFDEPTRGWCFAQNGYLKVASGAKATVNNVITYGTRLAKEGEGTLVLGSRPLRFDENVRPALIVQDGVLGVACTDALAGLDVTFEPGTAFVVDADRDDSGMLSRGADLTDTGVTAIDGIDVRIEVSSTPTSCMDVAIATVNLADAESFASKLKVKRVSRCKTALKSVTNGDGTVTFMARISPAGLCISIK